MEKKKGTKKEVVETLDINETKAPSKNSKLQGEVIGQIVDRSKNGPLVSIIVFILLIAAIIFLPYLNNIVDTDDIISYFKKTDSSIKDNTVDINEKEDIYYSYNATLKLVFDEMQYDNFKIIEDEEVKYFAFDITNIKVNSYNLNSNNIYMELYSSDKTLLQRIRVYNLVAIASNQKVSLKYELKEFDKEVNSVKIIKYTENDFPVVSLKKNEEDIYELVCTKKDSTTKYQFENDKLVKILDHYSYTESDDLELYAKRLLEYKEKANKMNNIIGMTATIVENDNTFIFNAAIDLTNAKVKTLNNPYYYEKDTISKIINFELESSMYYCD